MRNGDYLGKIARKYGVKVSQIKRWNGLRNNNIKAGQRLTIYPRDAVNINLSSKKTSVSTRASANNGEKKYGTQK